MAQKDAPPLTVLRSLLNEGPHISHLGAKMEITVKNNQYQITLDDQIMLEIRAVLKLTKELHRLEEDSQEWQAVREKIRRYHDDIGFGIAWEMERIM